MTTQELGKLTCLSPARCVWHKQEKDHAFEMIPAKRKETYDIRTVLCQNPLISFTTRKARKVRKQRKQRSIAENKQDTGPAEKSSQRKLLPCFPISSSFSEISLWQGVKSGENTILSSRDHCVLQAWTWLENGYEHQNTNADAGYTWVLNPCLPKGSCLLELQLCAKELQ